jgi:hypothetical protein
MLKKIMLSVGLAVVAALLTPSWVSAYGAAHVGYTAVGPNGAYHTSATAVSGPGGTYAGSHTTAVGSGGSSRPPMQYGTAAYGNYHYSSSYSGGASASSSHYGFVR